MRSINEAGLALLRQAEGLRLTAYPDSAGLWTSGYGHRRGAYAGQTCTKDQAEAWLHEDAAIAANAIEMATGNGARVWLNDNQFSALCVFVFNIGATAFRTSTLRQRLVAGDLEAAPGEMRRWCHDTENGVKVISEGLVNRRAAEIRLWSTPV